MLLEPAEGSRQNFALCGVYGVWLAMVDIKDLCAELVAGMLQGLRESI